MEYLGNLYSSKDEHYFNSKRIEIEKLLPTNRAKVLEIGCGSGATLSWLKQEKGSKWVAGVELTENASARARDQLDFFITGDIEKIKLPFDNASLDLILCLDVLEHLVDPWLTIKNLNELLKPGGTMIVSLPNVMHRSAMLPLLLNDRWDYVASGILDRTHLRFFTKKTAVEMLENSGLQVDAVLSVIPIRRGSRVWFFDLLTLHIFRRFFTTQYIARGILCSIADR
jgi:2-polyprenyl-3-methyl-5-hydroxy-6-metoxy-1,4-benzoquinol methylase